jgi:glycerol uptake facilitator protein
MAGFGTIAIPGPRAGFWIYIVGPFAGALVGEFIYDRLVGHLLPTKRIMLGNSAEDLE